MKPSQLLLIVSSLVLFDVGGIYAQQTKPKAKFKLETTPGRNRGTFNYTLTTTMETYSDLTGSTSINNGEIWDDPAYLFEIGFDFELNGNVINFLEFDGVGAFLRSETGDPDVDTYVFPFEIDLIDRGSGGPNSLSPISYTVTGAPGSRIMKLEMKNAGSWIEFFDLGTTDMFVNLQMWLHEGSNVVEFRFGPSFINNPDIFFADGGAYAGIADYNFIDDVVINPHFIVGDAGAPQLSISDITIEGMPEDGMVYRLTPISPVEVEVTGFNSTSFCEPDGSATASVNGGTEPWTFEWSNGGNTSTIANLDGGTYTVTVTDALGSSATGSITITAPAPLNPNAGATDETGVDLNDGTAFSAAFGGTPPYDYEWSNGESTQAIENLAPGPYTVTVTDDVGCTATETVNVNAFECEAFEVEVFTENPSCAGVCDGTIELFPTGGSGSYTFIWCDGSASNQSNSMCAGICLIDIVDGLGCVVEIEVTLTDPEVVGVVVEVSDESGINLNDGIATAFASGGTEAFTYLWNNGETTQTITNLPPGAYMVTVTDENGCTAIGTGIVNEFNCSGAVTGETSDVSCYSQCNGAISLSVDGGVGPFEFNWLHGDSTAAIANLCAGEYAVLVFDEGQGCILSAAFFINQPDSITINVDQVIHVTDTTPTGSIFIGITGGLPGYSVVWLDTQGNIVSVGEDLIDVPAGFYLPSVLDINGCLSSIPPIEIRDETVSTTQVPFIDVRIYPNPAYGYIYMQLDQPAAYRLTATTPDGRSFPLSADGNLVDIHHLPQGLCVIKGVSEENAFVTSVVVGDR